MKLLFAFLLLIVLGVSIHISEDHDINYAAGVYLKGNSGLYASKISGVKFVEGRLQPTLGSIWSMRLVSGNKYTLSNRLDGGYLSRCNGCLYPYGSGTLDVATTHITDSSSPHILWQRVARKSDGKHAFKGSNGKYLNYCYLCAYYPGASPYVLTVNSDNPEDAWSGFSILQA